MISQNGQTKDAARCCKIFKVRFTIFEHYTLKSYRNRSLKI